MTPEQAAAHRLRMRRIREDKIQRKECLRCSNGVAYDPITEEWRRQCQHHLDLDAARSRKRGAR
jgi:hypothetical protein